MKRVYEPEDVEDLPEKSEVEPHIELIPGVLRLHFHSDGVSFGLIHPTDERMSAMISFEEARMLMLAEAANNR